MFEHLEWLVGAQIHHAIGVGHLYVRGPNGKFFKVENEAAVEWRFREGYDDCHRWIFTKDPNVQAFSDLMNRALDKPAAQVHELHVSSGLTLIEEWLLAARKRVLNDSRSDHTE